MRKEFTYAFFVSVGIGILLIGIGILELLSELYLDFQEIAKIIIAFGIFGIIGLYIITYQIRKSSKIKEGEYIINLNNQFFRDNNISQLFLKLEKYERSDKSVNIFSEDDIPKIVDYLNFFRVVYSLKESRIINFRLIDNMFSYQFFLLLNNSSIQELELLPGKKYYGDIVNLYVTWKDYREKQGLEILNEDCCILSKIIKEI